MNRMKEIANMFNKELEQPFFFTSEVYRIPKKVRFSLNGMEYYDNISGKWYQSTAFLRELLTGKAKIIEC